MVEVHFDSRMKQVYQNLEVIDGVDATDADLVKKTLPRGVPYSGCLWKPAHQYTDGKKPMQQLVSHNPLSSVL